MKLLIIDNYDSFTYNIYNCLYIAIKHNHIKKFEIKIIKNDERSLLEMSDFGPTHIVFGPGKGTVNEKKDIGISEEVLTSFFSTTKILGICLGHQLICKYFGSDIIYANEISHGKIDLVTQSNNSMLFEGLPQSFYVMRYHSQISDSIPKQLRLIAQTNNNYIMAVEHTLLPIYGIQFHPESFATKHGQNIFNNFILI